MPTPLLQIHKVHYPPYIPVPGNFSTHPGQPILIPSSSITVLNQQDQMLCVQSAPNLPINMNSNPQYSQNIAFHKVNTMINKNNSDILTQAIPSQQDVILSSQFSSFRHEMSPNRNDDMTMKQPVLLQQNHVSPFQIINNNFHYNTNKGQPAGDIHSTWRGTSAEKSKDIINEQKKRLEKSTRRSVSDLRGSSTDLDLSSRRSFSETDVCETTTHKIHVNIPSRPTDTTVLSPNDVHRNPTVGKYKISYKSKLIGSTYTHVADPSMMANNQARPMLIPNVTDINNFHNIHPNVHQVIVPLTLHKMNQNDNISPNNVNSLAASVLSVSSYSHEDSIVSSMSKLHSPQVYISTDKQTLPTGINGGYIQNPVTHETCKFLSI